MIPTAKAAIHELTQRSMIRSVWLVVPRSVGSQPFSTSGEHPVKTNAPASAKPVIEVIFMRRLPVRFCELTDGPSSCCCLPAGRRPTGHTKSFTTRCRAYRYQAVFAHMSAPWLRSLWKRSGGAPTCGESSAQWNESPQAQEPPALGLSMVKPCFEMVSSKSMLAPLR